MAHFMLYTLNEPTQRSGGEEKPKRKETEMIETIAAIVAMGVVCGVVAFGIGVAREAMD